VRAPSSASAGAPERPSSPSERDVYADLLRDTRGLAREHAHARDAWVARIAAEHKEDALFELEVLLKGLACFSNPRNHPGPPRRAPGVAQDYREQLAHAREGMARIIALARFILNDRDRTFVFQRYLETVLPDDTARTRLAREALAQSTPEQSLGVLRSGMANIFEVAGGVTRLARVPFRVFYSLLAVAHREIWHSTYFNPLTALEFRPEFDRITNPHILELTRGVPGEHGRRLVALAFLSLFRMLRYLSLLEAAALRERADAARPLAGVVYLVMSVLRSDARALTGYLRKRSGPLLAEGLERDIFRIPAKDIGARYDALLLEGHRLIEIRATLEGIAANLRLELRRTFEHDFPPPELAPSPDDLRAAVRRATGMLRPALQNAVLVLGKALGARLDEHGIFDDATARRTLSERLRRDVWMFAQIVRAFAQKARAVPEGDVRWSTTQSFQFVREFLAYFRAMGYPLLRAADYPRFDAFLAAMAALEETDLLETSRLHQAIAECEVFYEFLTALFDQIGRRVELATIPFDRRAAAEALKLYLASES
jgi:hypothetical protein